MRIFKVELDTAVSLDRTQTRISDDPNDENESGGFLEIVEDSGTTYRIIDPEGPGGGWPTIEYRGTLEQLAPVLACLDANGRDAEEILEEFEDYSGTNEEFTMEFC